MMRRMQTTVDLPEGEAAELAAFCERRKLSPDEAVAMAIRLLLADQTGLADAFGIWKDRNFDAREYVNEFRSEWDERESRLWADRGSSTATS